MSRILPYRFQCTKICLEVQNDALQSTFFILRQTGPTAFVLKDDRARIFKVFLGDQHQCTCSTFQHDKELCKHIYWLLLKRFRIPRTNSMVWQHGLVEREINELLRGLTTQDNQRNKLNNDYKTNVDNQIEQRIINENDLCPICQEEFLIKKLPITYCRHSCGNNVHIKCMKIWLDHQVSIGEKTIKCPLCREIFGTPEELKKEFRINDGETVSIHLGYSCHRCHVCPITDKCYKCTICQDYYLCQTCFNLNFHNEHSFDYREKSFQSWKIAQREHLTALPNVLHHMLTNGNINENDYEILLQLENAHNTTAMGIPENIVKALPTELIQHDEQCRLCLRSYQIGERVRRLPCRHKFHIDCIDGWLLHSHPICPVDGQLVWSVEIESEKRETKRLTKTGTQSLTKIISHSHSNSSLLSANMGLTITPYRIQTPINSNLNQRPHMRTPLRSLITPMSFESPQSLQINTRNTKLERQHISRSLTTEDIRRLNLVLRQDRSISTNAFPYQRSRSNVK